MTRTQATPYGSARVTVLLATALLACGDSTGQRPIDGGPQDVEGLEGPSCGRGTVQRGNVCVVADGVDAAAPRSGSRDASILATDASSADVSMLDAASRMDASSLDASATADAASTFEPPYDAGWDDGGAPCHTGCWTCGEWIDPDPELEACRTAQYFGGFGLAPCGPAMRPKDVLSRCMCDACPACITIWAGNFRSCQAYLPGQIDACTECLREQEQLGTCSAALDHCNNGLECPEPSDAGTGDAVHCALGGGFEGDEGDPSCGVSLYDCSDGLWHAVECVEDSTGALQCQCLVAPSAASLADGLECERTFSSDLAYGDCFSRAHLVALECGIDIL